MKKEFVPYDIALAMKELGFDDGCIAWYYHEELRYMNLEDDVPVKNNIELTGTYETDKYCYAAPLYQQAFAWFREQGIHSEIEFIGEYRFSITTTKPKNIIASDMIHSDMYDTYEEAQDACLRKLIEIVKNK
jgi:hypothetical protein